MPSPTELEQLQAALAVCEAEVAVLCAEVTLAEAQKNQKEMECEDLRQQIAECEEG